MTGIIDIPLMTQEIVKLGFKSAIKEKLLCAGYQEYLRIITLIFWVSLILIYIDGIKKNNCGDILQHLKKSNVGE